MAIDFMTGVGKQLRIDKKKLTSHAAWLWIAKKLLVFVMIGAMSLAFVWLKLNPDQLLDTTFAILITSELYSILQNIYAIRTGLILPEFDVVSIILKTFWDFLKDKLDKMTKIQAALLDKEWEEKASTSAEQ
jgi:phage-related holin